MTLTKADISEPIYNHCGFYKTKSGNVVETILEIIKGTPESGEDGI